MLEVSQTRTIQWERQVSELTDSEMVSLASEMLAMPAIWSSLYAGQLRTETVSHNERRMWLTYMCIEPGDDILLEILHVQDFERGQ